MLLYLLSLLLRVEINWHLARLLLDWHLGLHHHGSLVHRLWLLHLSLLEVWARRDLALVADKCRHRTLLNLLRLLTELHVIVHGYLVLLLHVVLLLVDHRLLVLGHLRVGIMASWGLLIINIVLVVHEHVCLYTSGT